WKNLPSCARGSRTPGSTWRPSPWGAAWFPARAGKSLFLRWLCQHWPAFRSTPAPARWYTTLPCIAREYFRGYIRGWGIRLTRWGTARRSGRCPPEGRTMQIGVYGSGYLGTVISACLADFGTPVTCCHPDSSRMVEMAQGKVPFHEKNLSEVIKRNVRSGRLAYSTDVESFARKSGVIFLAEATRQHLPDLALRISKAVAKPPILCIVTPVSVGTGEALEKKIHDAGLKAVIVSQPMFFTAGCAVEDFNWPDRIILGSNSNDAVQAIKQIFHPLVMRGVPVIVTNHATAELVRESATAFVAAKI